MLAPPREDLLWQGRSSFPGTPTSIGDSRAWVRTRLVEQGIEPPADLEVVLSELATNAIRHTRSGTPGGRFALRVLAYPDRVRIEVRDGGPFEDIHPLHPATPALLDEHGRGLLLVEAFSTCWGRLPSRRGVYAEVAR
ncbi:ATP-binding protein [Nocardiopsis sp. FR4]|uniref:ATP-binding protein n=1 Tax=Nocardiopsis sp. FR4 TaxID=2605985 RepID=UPI00135879B3|nr:ATP-binding protein [Nocardiopsis sp. FR4]